MRRVWTFGGGLATAAALGIIALAVFSDSTPASPPQLPEPLPGSTVPLAGPRVSPFVPRGAGSCSAQACHGGMTPSFSGDSRVFRNEHTTWITRDPHNRAYEVLSGERSARIAKNLGVESAEKDARCLACHATPSLAKLPKDDDSAFLVRDGVGCESCHGASSRWAPEHVSLGWRDRTAKDKQEAFGFTDLADLARRAENCAGCHVGAPASDGVPLRDVNHDLIAAGHPRLAFEYSAFMANYPKHWDTSRDPRDQPARLWKVGQVVTLKAAVALLHERARLASIKKAPWPELAEYSCFSCHFALKDFTPGAQAFRGLRDADDPGGPGVPSWGSWDLPMIGPLVKAGGAPAGTSEQLARLRASMARFDADPKQVAGEAKALGGSLDAWLFQLAGKPFGPAESRPVRDVLDVRDGDRRKVVTSWDSAAQVYLALAAFYTAEGSRDAKLREELEKMRKELGFQPGFDAPKRDFHPANLP